MLARAMCERYSVIRHLAYSIWLNHDPATRHMAIFTAFFDASGGASKTNEEACFFVSGFVSTVEKWMAFEIQWLELLDRYSIKSPFHMTDFVAGWGQYKSWKDDHQRRDMFLSEALDLIHKRTHKGFSSGVYLAHLRRMFAEYEVTDVPPEPYAFCGLKVLVHLHDWAKNRMAAGTVTGREPLHVIFEAGDLHKGIFMQSAKDRFGYLPTFLEKENVVPFQACDILAWEHQRRATTYAKNPLSKSRLSYLELERRFPNDAMRLDYWGSLEKTCERLGFRKRQ